MKSWTSKELRKLFLDFFKMNGHTVVPSSSLVPHDDPSLLFTNAGMNQFKDVFLGRESRPYTRATSSQKCVRAGGKHNDLDEVGFTNRHLTFFEMLGNFSFGDYFKEGAIEFAWKFLTEEVGLPRDRLVVSVYKTDDEAAEIWNKKIGLSEERIFRLGEKDNFWQMGETGPCGPCTEIHFDTGKECPGCDGLECDCGRFLEVWNLVFMQYNRHSDGRLEPLTRTGVDTGMGLERLAMIVQGVESIFEADPFRYLIEFVEKELGEKYGGASKEKRAAFNVLADHIRSSSLIITDGCTPSIDGRGYVLRKIIRRAILFASKLGNDGSILPKLAMRFAEEAGDVYEGLWEKREFVRDVLQDEVDRFKNSLANGRRIFDKVVSELEKSGGKIIPGKEAFELYDTYGFPLELTKAMAREIGLTVDESGFEKEMEKQRERSQKVMRYLDLPEDIPEDVATNFTGYEKLEDRGKVEYIKTFEKDGKKLGWVIVDRSPMYAESGGQVADTGWLHFDGQVGDVLDVQKVGGASAKASAILVDFTPFERLPEAGSEVKLVVDGERRADTMRNHTATHLMHAALGIVLGPHIKQAGSLVEPGYLRFDFTHHGKMSDRGIREVEDLVNEVILSNSEVEIFTTTLEEARRSGVKAFFGEKYDPTNVRVVRIGDFSAELCGGTHVKRTGDIGLFKIISESALSSGTRRIVAVTGRGALKALRDVYNVAAEFCKERKVKLDDFGKAIERLVMEAEELRKSVAKMKGELLKARAAEWFEKARSLGKFKFVAEEVDVTSGKDLRTAVLDVAARGENVVAVFAARNEGKMAFALKIPFKEGEEFDLLLSLLRAKGIKCGGKNGVIQGGGEGIAPRDLFRAVEEWIGMVSGM